jgi:hypothetical protein
VRKDERFWDTFTYAYFTPQHESTPDGAVSFEKATLVAQEGILTGKEPLLTQHT